jgi:asparagine N-glycosylation enzyme membrane subunit Stt3
VYLVLAKIVTFLPIRDVAFRVNLFSAIMASLTIVGVYLSGRMIVKYRIIALMGSFALAISPTFWSQAVIAEVYTSGAVFLVFILFFLLYWDSTRRPEMLFIAGFLGGGSAWESI